MKGIKFALGFNMCNLKSFVLVTCLFFSQSTANDFSVTPVTTSSGIYYEKIGEVLLSNSNWQFVTSVDYRGYLLFYEYLLQQAKQIEEFCQTFDSSTCRDRSNAVKDNMNRVAKTDETMANFLGIEGNNRRRVKRWLQLAAVAAPYILEPLGKALVGKIFGDMNQNKLMEYDGYINNLYKSQMEQDYKLLQHMTMFVIDSERKNYQIQWLKRAQSDLENNINILQSTVAKDSEENQKELKSLQAMLDETNQKLKQQKDNQNKLASEINDIKDRLKIIDNDIKAIKEQVSANTNNINNLNIKVQFDSITINLNFLLSKFENEQKVLLDVIKNANRGFLDPYIITPLNLIEMMVTAQAMLPENTKFPFYPNFLNAQKLYNLIKPTVYLYNNKILFILTIPVVNGKTFGLHKMTSLPIAVEEDKLAFILPKQPYLVVDKNDQEYTMFSRENFEKFCNGINARLYLCDQIRQVSPTRSSSDCEMTLFLNSKIIPISCNKRLMQLEKPVFLQLQEPMSWIYASPSSEDLVITCGNNRETVSLRGSGFVKLNKSCSALTSQSSLFTIARFTSTALSSFSPRVNISESIELSNIEVDKENNAVNYREMILPFDYRKLESMSTRYQKDSSDKASLWTSTTSICITLILIGISALVILVVYKKYHR